MRTTILLALLLCVCTVQTLALKPDRRAYSVTPATTGLRFEERRITTPDRVQLLSWTILPEKDTDLRTVLVLAYGDGGNMSYWLPQAASLADAGFTLVMFDYRGFGASDSVAIPADYLYLDVFAADLIAVCADVRARYPAHKKMLWGFSMGTLIGTLAWPELKLDGFFGEGFITDPARVVARIRAQKRKELLLPPSAATYATHLADLPIQVHTLTGFADSVTTIEDSRQFSLQKPGRVFIEFNGGHGDGWNGMANNWQGRNGYVDALVEFAEDLNKQQVSHVAMRGNNRPLRLAGRRHSRGGCRWPARVFAIAWWGSARLFSHLPARRCEAMHRLGGWPRRCGVPGARLPVFS